MFGKGSISFTPSLSLPSILHIPDLSAKLLSIACITHELICRVIFYYKFFFSGLVKGRIIGNGSLSDGLYLLDSQPMTQGWLIDLLHCSIG
jgi:hypothetical protein